MEYRIRLFCRIEASKRIGALHRGSGGGKDKIWSFASVECTYTPSTLCYRRFTAGTVTEYGV